MFASIYKLVQKQVDQVDQVDHPPGKPRPATAPGWSTRPAYPVHGPNQVDHEGPLGEVGGPVDQHHAVGGPPGNAHGEADTGGLVHLVHLVHQHLNNNRERETETEPDARERLLRLGTEHPGGLVGRFGPATAGALLAACHACEAAREAEADDWDPGDPAATAAALATFDTMMAAALAAEETV